MDDSQRYRLLYTISHALHEQQGDTPAILRTTLWLTEQALNAERGCIVRFEKDGTIKDAYMPESEGREVDRDLWQQLALVVQHGGRTVAIGDLSIDQPWPQHNGSGALTGSAVAVPMIREEHMHGALMLRHPAPHYFDEDCIFLLEQVAETAAVVLENAERFELLAGAHALYRRLYQDAAFAIFITDLQGEIIDANPKAINMLGFDRHALLGLPINAVLRISSKGSDADNLNRAASGKEIEFAAAARRPRGEALAVQVLARRMRLKDENYIVWATQDVSAQVHQEQYRRDLAAMTYHDLRGPLHNINSSLSRLEHLLSGEQHSVVHQLMHLAMQSTRQLTRMVNSLLDLERLESGKANVERKLTPLATVINDAAELLQVVTSEADQELLFDVEHNLPPLALDQDMILRVIINLVENAVKYTPDGGRIILAAHHVGNAVCVSISDSGPGIPAEMREQVFDKYVRVKNKQMSKGIGLGLAFCRLAIEAHGGRIWVESDPQTNGARFSFTLPVENHLAGIPVRTH